MFFACVILLNKMPKTAVVPLTLRQLSKKDSHFLVKYHEDGELQVRSRGFVLTQAKVLFEGALFESRYEKTSFFCIIMRMFSLYASPFYIRNFKPLPIFSDCTAWFGSDLVGNRRRVFSQRGSFLFCLLIVNMPLNEKPAYCIHAKTTPQLLRS